MSGKLFDEYERTDLEPAKQSEPKYEYLNRTARSAFTLVREVLEAWFREFPGDGRDDLRARFRANRADTHSGAFFELYCHALMRAHGFSVTLHPNVDGKRSTRLDFLVRRGNRRLFYVEATLGMPNTEYQATAARDAQLEDAINKMDLPAFFVCMSVIEEGKSSPSWVDLRRFIAEAAAGLDADDTAACRAARFEYRTLDWVIEIWFIPKKLEARGKIGLRPLGMTTSPAQFVQPQEGIKSSLKKKASKYGQPDLPYIVAINCLHDFVEEDDIAAALFGDEEFVVTPGKGVTESRRRRNGFWWGPKGYMNRRVSGVLVANQLVPWTVGSVNPKLCCNPIAKRPFDLNWWKGDRYVLNSETRRLQLRRGITAHDLLGTQSVSQAIAAQRRETT